MNEELSNKLRIAGFICTVMVLYRHSLNYMAFFNSWTGFGINKVIQGSTLNFTEIAVPFFFIVSGFFFFKRSYYSIESYRRMIEKKFRSLFVPFLIWNILGMFILLVVSDYGRIGDSILVCVENLFYSRWNGPLWYIRDLMIMMMFVFVYNWVFIVNKIWLYGFIALLLYFYWIPVDTNLLSSEGMFFFFVGGIISKNDKILRKRIPVYMMWILVVLWIYISMDSIILRNIYLHRCNTIIGICAFWQLLNYIPDNLKCSMLKYSSYSFLIYVMHPYMIKIIKNSVAYFFFGNEQVALVTFIILPIMVTFIIIYIGGYWKKFSCKTYDIVTGNR